MSEPTPDDINAAIIRLGYAVSELAMWTRLQAGTERDAKLKAGLVHTKGALTLLESKP